MSVHKPLLQPGEKIVWQGKPSYTKFGLPVMISISIVLLVLYYPSPRTTFPVPTPDQSHALVLVFGLLILLYVYIDAKYAAVTYYITDKRVIRNQDLPLLRNRQEILFQSIVRIVEKWRLGSGHLAFQAQDSSILTFGELDADPHVLRQMVERMIMAGVGR